jgi:Ni,Fe-hydrogenase maturation factor
MKNQVKMLFYGYGDTSKQDEGIGTACAACLEQWIKEENIDLSVQVERHSQLNVANVETMADKDIVVFIDSSKENISDFYMSKVVPTPEYGADGVITPGHLVHMCTKMFQSEPLAFVLHIKGYKWKEHNPLTNKAQYNLCKALEFIKEKIKNPAVLIHTRNKRCSIDLNKST